MLWLALHFPSLHLNSLMRASEADRSTLNTESSDLNVVIDAHKKLVQLDDCGREQGLKLGMKLGTASAIARHVRALELDEALEERRLNELALQCYALSSDVVLRIPQRCLLIEFSGMLKLHHTVDAYYQAVMEQLATEHVALQCAIAPSPLLAELLAMWQHYFERPCLYSPDAFKCSQSLPVSCLESEPSIIQKLTRLGLSTLGDVRALPETDLVMRLGQEFVSCLKQLEPNAQLALERFKLPEHFQSSVSFDAELHTTSALLFPARRLLDRLEVFLRRRSQSIQSLACLLYCRNQAIKTISLNSAHPESSAQHWHELLRLQCDKVVLDTPIIGLEIRTEQLLALDVEPQDLFSSSVSGRSVSSTLNRIKARLGSDRVQYPSLRNTHIPERSFEYRSDQDTRTLQRNWRVTEPLREYAKHTIRPTVMLPEPVTLSETVRIIHGPERIQSAWWQGDTVGQGATSMSAGIERDYFVALNDRKQLLWVFRDAEQNWFVHGLFA